MGDFGSALLIVFDALDDVGIISYPGENDDVHRATPLADFNMDSVDCIDLQFRLERACGVKLPEFGPQTTIDMLATYVVDAQHKQANSSVTDKRES